MRVSIFRHPKLPPAGGLFHFKKCAQLRLLALSGHSLRRTIFGRCWSNSRQRSARRLKSYAANDPKRKLAFIRCTNEGFSRSPSFYRLRAVFSSTPRGGAAMTSDNWKSDVDKRSSADRRTGRDRRSGVDTRLEEEKRTTGERRTNADRRSGLDRRASKVTDTVKGQV